ncbi:SCO family protein [Paenibacillus herberti]|uniref:SCO family protein n=1 Tax=Paenibacillus herberti TaxID=1619309 RepID=A0A229NTD6_9BACL|nr:SCO family protein [Paenibacillus herberti]OXM13094.1 SCO family protein [Paenibacillus herberti]
MPFVRKHAFKIALFALCALMGAYLLYTNYSESRSAVSMPIDKPAPAFTLQNVHDNNKEVSLADSDGKVRLYYFYWANCPDVCPATTFILSKVQDQLKEAGLFGSKVEINSVTFDPERDTPEKIQAFAAKFNADTTGWKFLRNPDAAVSEKLVKDFGLSLMVDENKNYSHNDTISVVDKKGKIRKYITGGMNVELTPDEIAASIVEAVKALT